VKFLLDAQLPPALARWLADNFGVEVITVREAGLRGARDREIFDRAKTTQTVVITVLKFRLLYAGHLIARDDVAHLRLCR
jgi:predicted nuclease of predicted toxin-antitoxin system